MAFDIVALVVRALLLAVANEVLEAAVGKKLTVKNMRVTNTSLVDQFFDVVITTTTGDFLRNSQIRVGPGKTVVDDAMEILLPGEIIKFVADNDDVLQVVINYLEREFLG